ncbi:hypothetical protein ACO0SA_002130 [Hanseniaspora valbyensis]
MEFISKAIWGNQPTLQERQQNMKRQLRRSVRATERDVQQQKRSLDQLKQQITKAAKSKKGLDSTNKTKLRIMGKEYLKLNKRLENTDLYKTTLESIALKFEQQIAVQKMAKNMTQTTGIMNDLHKFGNLAYLRNSVMELEKGMFQLGMKEEMLDDIMLQDEEDEFEDEEEEENINKLLEEIAPEIKEQKTKSNEAIEQEKLTDLQRVQDQVTKSESKFEQDKVPSKEQEEEPVPEDQMDDEVDNMIKQMKDKLKALQT